jgi:site-specific recombinase XerD
MGILERFMDRVQALALDGVSSPHSRRAYAKALADFFAWYREAAPGGFHKAAVQGYRVELERRGLAPATITLRISAIRKLALEAADNGLLAPEIAAGIARVKGPRRLGVRAGNWLSLDQAEQLLQAPDPSTPKGLRDRALLGVLLGCGLRRNEAAVLSFDHLQQRNGRWVIVDLEGKHGRIRSIPMPGWAKVAINAWAAAAGLHTNRVFRAVRKSGRVSTDTLTAQAIFETVVEYAASLGLRITPHDLRRTFAHLAHRGRAPLEQIQFSLGHASILTTERYLGIKQDLTHAPCDCLGISMPPNVRGM